MAIDAFALDGERSGHLDSKNGPGSAAAGRVSLAERLEALGRLVPGVAGYLDRERSRDTDKAVRERIASGLAGVKRDLEGEQRRLAEAKDLTALPALDRLGARVDGLAGTVRYAARGYRGLFDIERISDTVLARLYDFDLGLFTELDRLRAEARRIQQAREARQPLAGAVEAMEQTLGRFERLLSRRESLAGNTEDETEGTR
jgi:hypothetical protein